MDELDYSDGLFTVSCTCGLIFKAENLQCTCGLTNGTLHLDINKMLDRIYNNSTNHALATIYDTFDHLYHRFDLMNQILDQINLSKINSTIIIAFLVSTFKYIEQVPNHLIFLEKAKIRLKELNLSDDHIYRITNPFSKTGNYWQNMKILNAPESITGYNPYK